MCVCSVYFCWPLRRYTSITIQPSHHQLPRKSPKGWTGEAKRRLLVPWPKWSDLHHINGGGRGMICSGLNYEQWRFNPSTMEEMEVTWD